jgi:hypothetical protein
MLGFCEGVQSTVGGQPGALNITLVCGEEHLHLDDHINKQTPIVVLRNSKAYHCEPNHPERVAIWCALSGTRIFSPMFSDGHLRCLTQSV